MGKMSWILAVSVLLGVLFPGGLFGDSDKGIAVSDLELFVEQWLEPCPLD